MAGQLYTPLPDGQGHYGERQFLFDVVDLGNDRTHVWGGVSYLPGGVPDIDSVIVQEDIGCFVVEVKAVSLEMIETFGLDTCAIRGRTMKMHPLEQSHLGHLGLRNYFASVSTSRCPILFATAAFPKIRRQDMARKFDAPKLRIQYDGMLFAEDLESQATFLQRLSTIRKSPPRAGHKVNAIPKPQQLEALIEVLDPGGSSVTVSEADRERGATVARNVGRPGAQATGQGPASKYLTPGQSGRVIFRGAAGTGKTVQLQEIAIAHARAGRAVLFTCYNKVLASTLRGILATQDLGEAVDRRIVITHVDELQNQLNSEDDIQAFRGLFGTICVDEAQDMKQLSLAFLSELADENAEWFLADGTGQELYGEAAEFLLAARESGTIEALRRNFRNSSAGFLVAQATYEHAPDISKIADWVAKRPLRSASEPHPQMLLDIPVSRDGGELPRVLRIDRSASDWRRRRLEAYVAVIFEELEKLAAQGKRRDLAILCAQVDSKSEEPAVARQALNILGVPFLDQIDARSRGRILERDHVRLVTIHSSRGIEASRVIVLGMSTGISPSPDRQANSRVMAYIALSRAQVATTIVVPDNTDNPYVTFIEEIVDAYSHSPESAGADPNK